MKRGMTLIEVMLAAVILFVGLTVLLAASSRCLGVMKRASVYQKAQWILGNGEAENPMDPDVDDVDEWEVSSEEYLDGFYFSREPFEVELMGGDGETEELEFLVALYHRVSWSEKNRDFEEAAISFRFWEEPTP